MSSRQILTSAGALLFVAVVIWTAMPASSEPQGEAERAASPKLAARDFSGKRVSLADYPQQVTVVNFWAVNCHACRIEIPHLQSLYDEYSAKDVAVIGIDREVEQVKQFVERAEIDYPVLVDGWETAQAYHLRATPTTVILDAQNRVYKKYVGVQGIDRFRKDIDALLGEKS